jgi:CheY-like chemotaxis protein
LLADDSVTAQNMGKKILSDAGYEVITVSNGSAALKKITELKPDIAVLDVYMPGHSGLEVCKLLKANPETADIPVLLTVGKLEPFKSDEALKARANAFIVKPFEASELLAVMRKIEDANQKPVAKPKSAAKSALAKAFAANAVAEDPSPDAEIEVTGWKDRIAMPSKKKAEPEPPEEDFSGTGTGFRDIAPIPSEGLRRESSYTADAVAEKSSAPEAAQKTSPEASEVPLNITPDEIAAIKAAVEVLSGEGDHAPILHVAAAEIEGVTPHRRELAPEPEYPAEVLADPQGPDAKPDAKIETKNDVSAVGAASIESEPTPPLEEIAAATPVAREATQEVKQEDTAQHEQAPAAILVTRWRAEAAELTAAEASVSLEQEMHVAQIACAAEASPTTYNLAQFAESEIASPVDDEPVLSDVSKSDASGLAVSAAESEPATLAVAAAASSASHATSHATLHATANTTAATEEYAPGARPFTQSFAAVPSLTPGVSPPAIPQSAISHSAAAANTASQPVTEFQDLRPQSSTPAEMAPAASHASADGIVEMASAAAAQPAPEMDRSAPDDEIDSRTKAQMDAAWSNWHDIRNTVVTPKLADQIEEVAEATTREEAGARAATSIDPGESSEIASIVDTMLAEMRPKLLEEIAKKLAAKKE